MIRSPILAMVTVALFSTAHAAQLDGVRMPNVRSVAGTELVLNGIGLRTYSFLGIRIYVAGLYLRRQTHDPNTIIHSTSIKLLEIRFLRDVSADEARLSWRGDFQRNCQSPCHLDPTYVQRFLAAIPSVHNGDEYFFLFSSNGVKITLNGRLLGTIDNRHFAEVMLSTFIGHAPPTPRLKRELLGLEK